MARTEHWQLSPKEDLTWIIFIFLYSPITCQWGIHDTKMVLLNYIRLPKILLSMSVFTSYSSDIIMYFLKPEMSVCLWVCRKQQNKSVVKGLTFSSLYSSYFYRVHAYFLRAQNENTKNRSPCAWTYEYTYVST